MKWIMNFLGFKKEFVVDGIKVRTNFVPQFELDKQHLEKAERIVKIISPIIKKWHQVNGGISFTRFNEQYHLTLRLRDTELDGDKLPKDIYQDIIDDFKHHFDEEKEKVITFFELNSSEEYIIITIVL